LSAQRALTVTRALIDAGVPSSRVFAAAFGAEQPVASNADEQGRARNRRVEIVPVPKPVNDAAGRTPLERTENESTEAQSRPPAQNAAPDGHAPRRGEGADEQTVRTHE